MQYCKIKYLLAEFILTCVFFSLPIVNADSFLPTHTESKHLGVATCAGSTCHGAQESFEDSSVLQNEFHIWTSEDPHSNAYSILLEGKAKQIAKNLSIESAEKSDTCLVCHSNLVDESARGNRFSLSDGVSCEACHGGAENWLGEHAAATSHEDNLAAGLYPLEKPVARARLCLSCHQGLKNGSVSHRLYGAGHPRLSFELDTFTVLQPQHYNYDDDYKSRKGVVSSAKTWAIGQLIQTEHYLHRLAEEANHQNSLFPELSVFECFSCHRNYLSAYLGKAQITRITVPKLNDSNILMTLSVIESVTPDQAKLIQQSLNNSNGKNSIANISKLNTDLPPIIDSVLQEINTRDFSFAELRSILITLNNLFSEKSANYYSLAEQATMAAGAILNTMFEQSMIEKVKASELNEWLDTLHSILADTQYFNSSKFADAFAKIPSIIN